MEKVNIEEEFTKYEIARIIGARGLQLAMDAPVLLKISKEELEEINYDPLKIAEKELHSGILPITVKRPMPGKREEKLKEKKKKEELEEGEKKTEEKKVKEKKHDEELEKKEIKEEEEIKEEGEIMQLAQPEDEAEEGEEKAEEEV